MNADRLDRLVSELERAWEHTDALWADLSDEEVSWRPDTQSSAIGWHLGHQAAVAHYMVRNLLAAEPGLDPDLDTLMDSATPEADRGVLPSIDRLASYRHAVAARVLSRIDDIRDGRVGAPEQLAIVGSTLLVALINHEYQHDQWIGEVRSRDLGRELPLPPVSPMLAIVDGYVVVDVAAAG